MAILVMDTPAGSQQYELADVMVMGRVEGCDVMLADQKVSRKHACIRHVDDLWLFEDQGSRNGSRVNGRPHTKTELSDGDVIEIDPYRLTFLLAPVVAVDRLAAGEGEPPLVSRLTERLSAIGSLDLSRVAPPVTAQDAAVLSRRLQASYEIAKATAATLSQNIQQRLQLPSTTWPAVKNDKASAARPCHGMKNY